MLLTGLIFLIISHIFFCHNSAVEWKDSNFKTNLESKGIAFVMFFAPWCGHCKNLKPIWDQLAAKKSVSDLAAIVKVDCTEAGKALCQKYDVSGYPTLKFFRFEGGKEEVLDYKGGRTYADLEAYVFENTRPASIELSDENLKTFIASDTVPACVGYFKNDQSSLFKQFESLSQSHRKDFQFGYTFSESSARLLGQAVESVVIYRQPYFLTKLDDDFVSTKDADTLGEFLIENRLNKVDIRSPKNEDYFAHPLFVIFTGLDIEMQKSSFRQFRNKIMKVAKIRKEASFAISFHREYSDFLQDVRQGSSLDGLYVVAFDKEKLKYVLNDTLTIKDLKKFEESFTTFVTNVLAGGVYEPFVKSQAVPTSNDGPVKVVVAKTFKDIVLDDEKDVLIELYAPWCGHCKKLEPIYNEVGELLKDEKHFVLAKMDATANEQHPDYSASGYPTIYLAKAGEKSKPITFDGKRDVKGIIEWLKTHTKFPIEFSGDIPESKKDL